jgi:hypothetical protein
MRKGEPVDLDLAFELARRLIESAERPIALASTWGSNEELTAFSKALPNRFTVLTKQDWAPQPGERLDDDLLIRADKNPNTAAAKALFPQQDEGIDALPEDTDLVLVWGEGFDFARIPARAKIVFLNAYLQPENGHADVFIPISIQTERRGHYTNFEGTVSAFDPVSEAGIGRGCRGAVRRDRVHRKRQSVIQDLVVHLVFIGYAVAVLLTFGTVLTWVERKQAAVMSDRIGANRAYVRIPFTQVKLIWLGLFTASPTASR